MAITLRVPLENQALGLSIPEIIKDRQDLYLLHRGVSETDLSTCEILYSYRLCQVNINPDFDW